MIIINILCFVTGFCIGVLLASKGPKGNDMNPENSWL